METYTINSEVYITKTGIIEHFKNKNLWLNTTIEPDNELYQTRLIDSKKRTIMSVITTFDEVENYISKSKNKLNVQKFFIANLIGIRKIWKEYCRISNSNLNP